MSEETALLKHLRELSAEIATLVEDLTVDHVYESYEAANGGLDSASLHPYDIEVLRAEVGMRMAVDSLQAAVGRRPSEDDVSDVVLVVGGDDE